MLFDRTKEEIADGLLDQVTKGLSIERADADRGQIEDTARWIYLIGRYPLEIDGDEPDFLVAPCHHREGL